jgi:hypothetical protein
VMWARRRLRHPAQRTRRVRSRHSPEFASRNRSWMTAMGLESPRARPARQEIRLICFTKLIPSAGLSREVEFDSFVAAGSRSGHPDRATRHRQWVDLAL